MYECSGFSVRNELFDALEGLLEGGGVHISEQDVGAVLGEEDGGFKADSAGGAGDDTVFPS